jgi:serine/threonine protein kinase
MIVQPGTRLQNRYEILHELGRGGMGSVFKVHDPLLDRVVAIKTLSTTLSADDSFIQRFQHEARAIARLNHPGIVGIFDVGQDSGVSFIVMEYIAGGSLSDLLKRESPLPPQRVVQLLEQIAVALDFAHSQGFVHRDIKPANILLDHQGKTRITDFGLVKMENIDLTIPGQVMGTPTYMAPEQIVGEEVSAATDIYSLAVVTYEMLTGSAPFKGGMTSVFDGHVRREPPPMRLLNPNLPEGFEPILRRALLKNPQERFTSATAFVNSLRQALSSDHPETIVALPAFATPPVPPGQPSTAATPPQQKKRAGLLLLAFAGLIGAVAILALLGIARGLFGGDEPIPTATDDRIVAAVINSPTPTVSASLTPQSTMTPTVTPSATAMPTETPLTPTPVVTLTPTSTPTIATPASATIATAQLNSSIFEEPDASSTELTFVASGESVTVLEDRGSWLQVRNNQGIEGWVAANRFEVAAGSPTATPTVTNTPPPNSTPTPGSATVRLPVSIFEAPRVNSEEITYLNPGIVVAVFGRTVNSAWLFIRTTDDIEGWVAANRMDYAGDVSDLPVISE